ncbi:MAG: DUF7230 family protein [Gammaproteobacteria bacterium]
MKKPTKTRQTPPMAMQNPVARHAHRFNKAQAFRDKTKYSRKAKHKSAEPFPMTTLERHWKRLRHVGHRLLSPPAALLSGGKTARLHGLPAALPPIAQ